MFSANENLQLRQYKRRVVGWIETTIDEDVLDLGVNVMVMQVSCKAPGCVPLETAIIIVFPSSSKELIAGLPESKGGSFKTKILKPLAEVDEDDVLDALPPAFNGGRRSMEKLCIGARDVMLAQITQLFGEDDDGDTEGRRLMAEYLKQSLQDYIDRGCKAPEWGEPFEKKTDGSKPVDASARIIQGTGNLVIRRPADDEEDARGKLPSTSATVSAPSQPPSLSRPLNVSVEPPSVQSMTRKRQQAAAAQQLESSMTLLSRLSEREHAPGIRRAGCPCCDPDHPSAVADRMMML